MSSKRDSLPTGRQIRAARILLNWSQTELAKRAEISRDTLSNFETEQRDTSPDTIRRLQEALEQGGARIFRDGAEVGVAVKL